MNFERGRDPKEAMEIGIAGRALYKAMLKSYSERNPMYIDDMGDWIKNNYNLALSLEYDEDKDNPIDDFIEVEEDYFLEENSEYDYTDFDEGFEQTGNTDRGINGLSVTRGKIAGTNIPIFRYSSSGVSGYITRKNWFDMKNNESLYPSFDEFLNEYSGTGAGGAGYAVWGGTRGGFGNPNLGGGGTNLGGGPNVMYTYEVKPLNQLFQQAPTPQGDERYIHIGSEIEGKVLGKDETIKGKIISSDTDEEGNILSHTVQVFDTAEKVKVDPTSVSLITHEERPDFRMKDFIGGVHEDFYSSLNDYLNENKNDAIATLKCEKIFERAKFEDLTTDVKGKIERSKKLPKELKEKIMPLIIVNGIHGTRYNEGKVMELKKPKVEGKSFDGVSLGADKNGFFVFTHRARSKSKPEIKDIPKKDISFIKSTG
jgi:hypothetical protein